MRPPYKDSFALIYTKHLRTPLNLYLAEVICYIGSQLHHPLPGAVIFQLRDWFKRILLICEYHSIAEFKPQQLHFVQNYKRSVYLDREQIVVFGKRDRYCHIGLQTAAKT